MGLMHDIRERLEHNQIPCPAAFPNRRMPRLLEPAVMLTFAEHRLAPFCFGNCLGYNNAEPFYAIEMNEKIVCEIYSPYLSGGYACDNLANSVFSIVADLLHEQISCSITRTTTYYDPDTDCFRATVVVSAANWMQCPEARR